MPHITFTIPEKIIPEKTLNVPHTLIDTAQLRGTRVVLTLMPTVGQRCGDCYEREFATRAEAEAVWAPITIALAADPAIFYIYPVPENPEGHSDVYQNVAGIRDLVLVLNSIPTKEAREALFLKWKAMYEEINAKRAALALPPVKVQYDYTTGPDPFKDELGHRPRGRRPHQRAA